MEVPGRECERIDREGYGYKDLPKYELTLDEEVAGFELQHAKYKKIIEEVCESWSPARNNDFFLFIEVLRCLGLAEVTSGKENFVFKIPRNKLKYLISTESIRRARQSLNAKGLCLPTRPEIIERRKKREKAIRKYFAEEK